MGRRQWGVCAVAPEASGERRRLSGTIAEERGSAPMHTFPPTMRTPLFLVFAALLASGCSGARPDPRERNPIVFVHGWSASGSVWETMTQRFLEDGWPEGYLVAWSYDTNLSNVKTAEFLAGVVDSVLTETGASRVDIVSHSMGALASRYYIAELDGGPRVDAWVSLGGPSHGTITAFTCQSDACREMRPGSAFLRALNEDDETPGTPRYATWRSPCDLVIIPQDSPKLEGAENTATECLLHMDLPNDTDIYEQVRAWVVANERGAEFTNW